MGLIERKPLWPGHEDHVVTVWYDGFRQVTVLSCSRCLATETVSDDSRYRAEIEQRERERLLYEIHGALRGRTPCQLEALLAQLKGEPSWG